MVAETDSRETRDEAVPDAVPDEAVSNAVAEDGRALMRRRRLRWRVLWVMWALYGVVVLAGVVTWMGREPEILTPAFAHQTPSSGDARLSPWQYGGRVRASSYQWFYGHHPLFAIDGVTRPERMERWSSAPRDREPWLESVLPSRSDVSQVFMSLSGAFPQHGGEPARHFAVSCHRGDDEVFRVEREDNIEVSLTMHVTCPDVDRVRVTFFPEPPVIVGPEVLSHIVGHWWREQPPDLSVHVWELSVIGKAR